MPLLLALTTLALASPPDKANTFSGGEGAAERVTVADNGALAAVASGGEILVVDVHDWSTNTWSSCTVNSVAIGSSDEADAMVFAGCHGGVVHPLLWNEDGGLSAWTGDEGAITWDLSTTETELSVLSLIWVEAEGTLYAISEDSDGRLYADAIVPDSGFLSGGFPVTLLYDGFVDAVATRSYILVAHGSDDVSYFSLTGGAALSPSNRIGVSLEDIHPGSPSLADSLYGVDPKGYLVQYTPSSTNWLILKNDLDDELSAVGVSFEEGEEWVVLGNDLVGEVYLMSGTLLASQDPEVEIDLDAPLQDVVVGPEGYVFAGDEDGALVVLTALPWISEVSATPKTAGEGDTVTLSFTVDEAGAAEVRLGGDRSGSGDVVVESWEVEVGTHQAEIEVDSAWIEGDNPLYVFVTDGDGTGHGSTSVKVDTPPDPPVLTDASVGFGDGSLLLEFDGIDDADLAYYTVYLTVTPFEGGDWDSGGPEFDGGDEVDYPYEITAEPGESVSLRVEPLTNGTTYYIGVRATDSGGLEGDMSEVVSGVPRESYGASELAGERGGPPQCGPGLAPAGWLVLLGVAGLVRRRRALGLVLASGALLLPGAARAGDMTPAWGNLELRYGSVQIEDEDIGTVYGDKGHDIFQLEVGAQLFRFVEVDIGIGHYRDLASMVDLDGVASSTESRLTWWPLTLDGTLRLHLLDEQVLVPHARFGGDYLMWNEKSRDDAGDTTSTDDTSTDTPTWSEILGSSSWTHIGPSPGAKFGYHYAFGLSLLLDTFSPARASTLESQTEINDTWLTGEYRWQVIEDGQGLVFTGTMITVGLKLDF